MTEQISGLTLLHEEKCKIEDRIEELRERIKHLNNIIERFERQEDLDLEFNSKTCQ